RRRRRRRRGRRARRRRGRRHARRAHRRRLGRRAVRAALAASLVLLASTAHADLSILERFRHEPSVRELQRAAVRLAEVEPERGRSGVRRAGKAATLPALRVRVGRGLTELTHEVDAQLYSTTDDWSASIEATWSLDRLVFDRNEVYASREAQRLAGHR